jgi:simple sugar transport system permease protein
MILLTPLVAIALTLLIGAVIFALLGYNPGDALYQFFIAPISRPEQVADLFVKACPLIIIATGLAFAYRANEWNIGAEGQMILGALFSGWVALTFPGLPAPIMMPLMILAGIVGGMLWAMIPALLKTRFNTNEILVSLMLTYVAALLIDWTVRGPWRDPMSFGFPITPMYEQAALIPHVNFPGIGSLAPLHWGVFGALILAVIAWFFLARTLIGFQVKVMGDAPRAAKFAGFRPAFVTVLVMSISGAAAGLAGMVEVSANIGQLQPNISFGYGFTAIIVAFLARLNPLGVIVAGLIVALAELGGDSAQIALGMPKVVTGVFQGILLFMLLACETFSRYRVTLRFLDGFKMERKRGA